MAFFNKVQQKTKDLADSARLSGTISEEEKKLNRLYTEIGKRYYDAHSLDEAPEFPEQLKAVAMSRQKIQDCQEQLQRLKGFIRCPLCGAEVPGSSAFCSSCGAPLGTSAPVGTCSKCNSPLQPGVKFCTRCGTPVSAAPAAQPAPAYQPEPAYEAPVYQPAPAYEPPVYAPSYAQPVSEAPAAQPEAQFPEVQRCPQCGAELEPGSLFCTNCGIRLGS